MRNKLALFFTIYLLTLFSVFAQSKKREVPYTKELYALIDGYYGCTISDDNSAKKLYQDAVASIPESSDEYSKLVHLARCDFFYGMYVMGEYDLSSVQNIKSMTDAGDDEQNLAHEVQAKKDAAGALFDSGIEKALKAYKMTKGADAALIYVMCISSNCTVKKTSYVLGNGLKVASYAKKSIAVDPTISTSYYYMTCQDIYAPPFFANLPRGLKKMTQFLNDPALSFDRFDYFNFSTAIGDDYFKQGNVEQAVEWYKKALSYYPQNKSVKKALEKALAK